MPRPASAFALLIGNQNYQLDRLNLANPAQRRRCRRRCACARSGFEVRIVKDAGIGVLQREVNRYAQRLRPQRLRRAGDDAIGFFYYSGHGAHERTGPLQLPHSDGRRDRRQQLISGSSSVRLKRIIRRSQGSRRPNAVHFVVFDACRNELKLSRSGYQVAAPVQGFSCRSAVKTARHVDRVRDGGRRGRLGCRTRRRALCQGTGAADGYRSRAIEAVTVFRNVQIDVFKATGQEPWYQHGAFSERASGRTWR